MVLLTLPGWIGNEKIYPTKDADPVRFGGTWNYNSITYFSIFLDIVQSVSNDSNANL